jgi:hypothetical protein
MEKDLEGSGRGLIEVCLEELGKFTKTSVRTAEFPANTSNDSVI